MVQARRHFLISRIQYQGGGYRRDRADDSFGIAGAFEEMPHEKFAVEPCGDIAIGIPMKRMSRAGTPRPGTGAKRKSAPVVEKASDDGDDLTAATGPQFEERSGKVTERDTLGAPLKAPGVQIEAGDRRGVHEKADGDEKQTASENVFSFAKRVAAGQSRQQILLHERYADPKRKNGKIKSAGVQGDERVGFFDAAGIIHQDHAGDGETPAKNVDANEARGVIFVDRFAICFWRWRSERFRGGHSVGHYRLKT